jgi:alpha-1,3-rhamnosyl/mannosyltransferase
VLEAMASGTPVACSDDAALREVGGDAAAYGEPVEALRHVLADRDHYVRAGLERARVFTWERSAQLTADVYRQVLAA